MTVLTKKRSHHDCKVSPTQSFGKLVPNIVHYIVDCYRPVAKCIHTKKDGAVYEIIFSDHQCRNYFVFIIVICFWLYSVIDCIISTSIFHSTSNYTPYFNEVESILVSSFLSIHLFICPSVCGQNWVHSVSSTIRVYTSYQATAECVSHVKVDLFILQNS